MVLMAARRGDMRWVMLSGPWRPMKLRFEVEAHLFPGGTRSPFMARHMEQPGIRNWAPALVNILSSPSCSHCFFTASDPGTMKTVTFWFAFLFFRISAAVLRSSILPLVQLPIKT